jgi:hypothetical protein
MLKTAHALTAKVGFALAMIGVQALSPSPAAAQSSAALEAERADFASWLETNPASPYAAVYHQPIRGDVVFGPDGSALLRGAPETTLSRGRRGISLETADGRRSVPRNRDVPLGDWRLRVSGSGDVAVLTVFAPRGDDRPAPGWFPVDEGLVVEGELDRPGRSEDRRMLGLDGVEVTATLAGTFETEVGGESVRFMAYRIPIHGTEEADISVFFQDGTSGDETYPPGRFVALQPLGGSRYRLDFNRARNPFCAYNTAFPCPIPWGNVLEARIEAGELYAGSDN